MKEFAMKEFAAIQFNFKLRQFILPPMNVKDIRKKTGLTQQTFADTYGFSLEAVKAWEAKRRIPRGAARIILKIIEKDPGFLHKVLEET